MTDKLIESVALAVWRNICDRNGMPWGTWEDTPPLRKPDLESDARAAILATLAGVREPSEGMINIGNDVEQSCGYGHCGDDARIRWQAMIDQRIAEIKCPGP